jgi:heat shock protein HtpX
MALALAGALEKLEAHSLLRPLPMNPGVAHMFIVNPLGSISLSTMFTTHPPVKDRIKRLQETAGLTEMHA